MNPRFGPAHFYGLLALGGALVLIGLGSAHFMEEHGHVVTGMNNQVVWGLPHVFAIFMIVAASGVLNVASIGSVFGQPVYKPRAPLSGLLCVAMLAGGLMVLMLDLGRPERLIVAATHYNLSSVFAWNVLLYSGMVAIVALYLWTMFERSMNRYSKQRRPAGSCVALRADHRHRLDLRLPGGAPGLCLGGAGAAVHRAVLRLGAGGVPAGAVGHVRLERPDAGRCGAAPHGAPARRVRRRRVLPGAGVPPDQPVLRAPGRVRGLHRCAMAASFRCCCGAAMSLAGTPLPLLLLFHPRLGGPRTTQCWPRRWSCWAPSPGCTCSSSAARPSRWRSSRATPRRSSFGDGAIAHYVPRWPEWLLGLGGVGAAFVLTTIGVRVLDFMPQDDFVGLKAGAKGAA